MLLAAAFVVLELSKLTLAVSILIIFASVALAFRLGLEEGRVREACQSTQKVDEDAGERLGRGHRS